MDHLHPQLDDAAIKQMSSLALAHVGDAVYEMLVRSYLACGGLQTAKNLHSRTIQLVRAGAQAKAAEHILPLLSEEEQTAFRHGRNAKPKSVPKSASVAEYAYATALEALFGWLYLKQRYDRINELFAEIIPTFGS
ncbi:Mini-ribonuclease 3 [Butyricicoccus sp. Marseille-Q5471]|uniref:Mini-ribonuclease 3 n=1 Tax=Butyricicoccus sp. Marseille-Q5471 TaxID=3039493 RepID=UPI0024BC320D|nr:ribonuclease III domain-containing protein [Butyricicoccus sp. Marseille-Q5471]